MKSTLTFLFIHICVWTGFSNPSDTLVLTYQHGITLEKIPSPGSKFMLKQLCTTQVDSIVSTGKVRHRHSKVGQIKDCLFEWKIEDDTLVAVTIMTFNARQTKHMISQVSTQFGSPIETIQEENSDCYIHARADQKGITIRMCIAADRRSAILVVRKA